MPVEVVAAPVRVTPDLKISGHLLTVVVFSKKVGIAGAYVSLFSNVDVKVGEVVQRVKFNVGVRQYQSELVFVDIS